MACTYFNELNPMYNATTCSKNNCFSMWQKDADRFKLINKGCWINADSCVSNFVRNILFCCCKGVFCNRHTNPEYCINLVREELNWSRFLRTFDELKNSFNFILQTNSNSIYFLIPILAILIFLLTIALCHKRLRLFFRNFWKRFFRVHLAFKANAYDDRTFLKRLASKRSSLKIEKQMKLGNGSFADIYKGKLNKTKAKAIDVAIKVFQQENVLYFKNEFLIYKLSNLKHDNILKFVHARIESNEYWLITAYQDCGSLLNFLKSNQINLNQLIQICLDISNGLAHLHGQNKERITIAHLDIKPSNILLNQNLNACLADFDNSKIFKNCKSLFDKDSFLIDLDSDSENLNSSFKITSFSNSIQNATKRYLSPEILNGTINTFKTPKSFIHPYIDSLLKSDIYSCALVYWEILNCLHNTQMKSSSSYRIVFENCKTDNELIDSIVKRRERPLIEDRWIRNSLELNSFCQTITECWSHDAKSRLSASRLYERVKSIHNLIQKI